MNFIGIGAMDVTKPYKFIGLGAQNHGWRRSVAARGMSTVGPARATDPGGQKHLKPIVVAGPD